MDNYNLISSTTNNEGIAYFNLFGTSFLNTVITFVFEGDSVYRATGVADTYIGIEKSTSNKYSSLRS